jgi:ribosomal protein L32
LEWRYRQFERLIMLQIFWGSSSYEMRSVWIPSTEERCRPGNSRRRDRQFGSSNSLCPLLSMRTRMDWVNHYRLTSRATNMKTCWRCGEKLWRTNRICEDCIMEVTNVWLTFTPVDVVEPLVFQCGKRPESGKQILNFGYAKNAEGHGYDPPLPEVWLGTFCEM